MNQYIATITKCPLFRNIDAANVKQFLALSHPLLRSYQKGEFIAIFGEPMEGIGILLEGRALLTRENMLGQRSIVTNLTASSLFGEALLFTSHPLWPATIQTTEPCKVLFIPFLDFASPLKGCESIQNQLLVNLLQDLSDKAMALTKKVHFLTLKGMRDKIFAYLREVYYTQNTLTLHLPHNRQEMADILNVSRSSMCRELSRLSKEGYIKINGRTIEVLSPQVFDL